MRLIDADHLKNKLGVWWDKQDEIFAEMIDECPTINPQEPYDFAKWVAREIFDEMWEYNKDAFAEIACRKLAKLGIVRAKSDEWELVEPQESEVSDADSD